MTVTDAVGHISHLIGIPIAAEMATGLGAIIAATVAGRIAAGMTAAGMTADTTAGMAGQEVTAGISIFLDDMSILKLIHRDDLTEVIITEAEVGAGTRTGEEETKIPEADRKARQRRHLTMPR